MLLLRFDNVVSVIWIFASDGKVITYQSSSSVVVPVVKPIVPGDILENIKDNYKPVVLEALLQI